ncbi:hypothetical protein C1H46_024377 [Malus baccata]|uniref:Uncharacterized protein n=1 Tax=Malus baccata TaxID=106549 RepID=A0A540LUV0_MALBA|nr:hypothetical protein C1H46_024377 [Malus baccata]
MDVNVKNNKKQNEEQTIDHGVQEHRRDARFHVHEFQGTFLSRHLKHQSRQQKRKQRGCYQRSCPIFHCQNKKMSQQKNKGGGGGERI